MRLRSLAEGFVFHTGERKVAVADDDRNNHGNDSLLSSHATSDLRRHSPSISASSSLVLSYTEDITDIRATLLWMISELPAYTRIIHHRQTEHENLNHGCKDRDSIETQVENDGGDLHSIPGNYTVMRGQFPFFPDTQEKSVQPKEKNAMNMNMSMGMKVSPNIVKAGVWKSE